MEERLSAPAGELLAHVRGRVATLTLNRPSALNALSFGMLKGLDDWLDRWEVDPAIDTVVLQGAGGKAFCAGGDLRALHANFHANPQGLHRFFEVEYALDYRIHTYPKPIAAVMDGIVMGGGMGLAQGARLRIVGDRTKMAMPETAIGLFPDVGGSYFLSRAPGRLGEYLGLVGPTIGAADAIYCGLADLDVGLQPLAEPGLAKLRPAIDRHFAHADIPSIVASLEAEADPRWRDWAQQAVAALARRSPTMLAVTLEQVRRGRGLSLADCLRMELNLVRAAFDQGDCVEGIRALMVEKDNNPRWKPARTSEVSRAAVDAFFAPRWTPAQHPLAFLQ